MEAKNQEIWFDLAITHISHRPQPQYVYAIIFVYRYFPDFGLGAEICEGLISWLFWFCYYK